MLHATCFLPELSPRKLLISDALLPFNSLKRGTIPPHQPAPLFQPSTAPPHHTHLPEQIHSARSGHYHERPPGGDDGGDMLRAQRHYHTSVGPKWEGRGMMSAGRVSLRV